MPGIVLPMGAPNTRRSASTNPTIRHPREMEAIKRRVDAHDSVVDGMDLLATAPPEWAAFEVLVYDRRAGRLLHHAWARSKLDAQATMASLRDLGHRAEHRPLGRADRSMPRRAVPPTPAQLRIQELQGRLREAWRQGGIDGRAVPSNEAMLVKMLRGLGIDVA